ncbi:MAG: TIGR01244 family sulfur transferase [Pseudomonadota bacterium]
MDLRQVTDTYFVSPQIGPEDMDAVAAAGITMILSNRPDAEIPPSHHASTIEAAAKEAGIPFVHLPLTHQTMTPDNIAKQAEIIDGAGGPVLAYCASGTRSTVAWALGQAGNMPVDDILTAARVAGYDLSNLRPTLEAAAVAKGS